MNVDEKLRELHNLGMKACSLAGKDPTLEPRTQYRLLPSGKAVILFSSSCFSFIPNNTHQLVLQLDELETYIEKAKKEVEVYSTLHAQGAVPVAFKAKPYVVPFVICIGGTKRIYKVHVCKDHRKDRCAYKPQCHCYITWEEF